MASPVKKLEIEAALREAVGGGLNSLRKEGFLPSVLYGHNFSPISLKVKYSDFENVYKKAGESTLINLKLDNKLELAMVKDVQADPVSGKFIHADFYRVKMDEKIHTDIPLVFVGDSRAVKAGGVLVKAINELEVEALPQDLPHEIPVDVSGLRNFHDEIFIRDLAISEKVKLLNVHPEDVVAVVQEPRKEEGPEVAAAAPEEVEVIKKEGEEGGAAPEAASQAGKKEEKK